MGYKRVRTVTSKKLQDTKSPALHPAGQTDIRLELAREVCTCGHRASSHAVLKYPPRRPQRLLPVHALYFRQGNGEGTKRGSA